MIRKGERLAVVMPVYNERDAVRQVLEKWSRALDVLHIDYEIRCYNDGSKDDTLSVLESASRENPRIVVIDKHNSGHGPTIIQGYRDCENAGFEWIFQIDSDDEMEPTAFAELWRRRDDYDFLVGRRDGRIQPWSRKIVSMVSRLCVRAFYGKGIWDVNTPYRLMRTAAFKEFYVALSSNTFAPNVILSGMAARCRLRMLELPVPQHDRTTGVVSIRKLRLIKAAIRSFFQTVMFAMHDSVVRGSVIGVLLSAILCGISLATINLTSFPTCDEIGTADTVINCILRHSYESHVWFYSYHPLHFFLLRLWLVVFGVSHGTVCGMNVFIGFVVCVVLLNVLKRRGLLTGGWHAATLCFLFWGGWNLSFVLQMGRIDILVMLFTLLTVDALIPQSCDEKFGTRLIGIWSFLLMLSGIYTIPLVLIISIISMPFYFSKKAFLKKWAIMISAFSVAFLGVCGYYLWRGTFLEFIFTYFQFNAILTHASEFQSTCRSCAAYLLDPEALVLFLAGVFTWFFVRKKACISASCICLIGLLPLFMVLSGRYMHYYAWIFYVPVCVFTVYVVSLVPCRFVFPMCCLAAIVGWLSRPIYEWPKYSRQAIAVKAGESFVKKYESMFRGDENVVLADKIAEPNGRAIENIFYYPLVQRGVLVWRCDMQSIQGGQTFGDKVTHLIDQTFQSPVWRQRMKCICQFLYSTPNSNGWPRRGILLVKEQRVFDDIVSELKRRDAAVNILYRDKDVNCAQFVRCP